MGIPAYFSHIVKNHTNIIKNLSLNPIKVDNLYLDCNSIIYDAFYKLQNENEYYKKNYININNENIANKIINKTIQNITEYINLIKPNNKVIIAFDGVAPVAKLEQQRSRRFKSVYQNSLTKSILKNDKPDFWNITAITPGTNFMKQLDEEINTFFNLKKNHNYNMQIIISGSNIPGEGEHKIFEYIRNNPDYHNSTNTFVYGLDADLIMLSLNHLPIAKNIYLFRETPEFIKSIHIDLEPNECYLLDIPELANVITRNMSNDIDVNTEQKNNLIYDYIFLCFFIGNDFMPHFPALNIRTGGIDKVIQAYKETLGSTYSNLTNGKLIYWKNVRKLLEFLSINEEKFIREEHKLRDKKEKHKLPDITPNDKINIFINIPSFERNVEKYINPYKPNWQERYYKSLFNIDINQELCQNICINYLEGLEWTMKYYTSGCPDWRWCYNYNYPPLLQDLIHYLPYYHTQFIKNTTKNPVSVLVQLCYVLPKQSLTLLPLNVYENIIKHKINNYKTECEFSWAYCKYFWECHPNLPHIDIDELENFITLIEK